MSNVIMKSYLTIIRAFSVVGALAAVVLMLGISVDVSRRYFIGSSILGMLEISETLMVFIVFLGIAYAEHAKTHVRMTLFTSHLPTRVAETIRLGAFLVSVWIVSWLAWQTTLRAISSVRAGEYGMGVLQLPLWPARLAISVGLLAATIELAIKVVDQVLMVVRGTPTAFRQSQEKSEIIGV